MNSIAPSAQLPSLQCERDIEAFENECPLSARIPDTIYDVFSGGDARFGEARALAMVETGADDEIATRISYADLHCRITQAANLFAGLGGAGVGVAYMLPSLLDTHAVLWGAETAGYAVPLNPLLELDHLLGLLEASGARIFVTCGPDISPQIWEKAKTIHARMPHITVVCLTPPADHSQAVVDFHGEMMHLDDRHLRFPLDRNPQRVVAYFHTGGTTNAPKLVAHTQLNQLAAAFGAAALLGIRGDDVVTNGMPLFHIGAVIPSSLAFFLLGAQVVTLSPLGLRNPAMVKNFWGVVERQGVTIVGAVPTALSAILSVPVDADLGRVRFGITGSASTPKRVVEKFREATGKELHEILGMTESAGATAIDPGCATPTLGSVGYRLPYTKLSIRKRNSDGTLGEECAPGEVGALLVAGPTVSPGYRAPVCDAASFVDGQLDTGDLAYRDARGKLFIAGRAKDLIIRSGHNIDPAVIESAFLAHPQVSAAAAVGEPDAYAGELPVCYVVLTEGAAVTVEELLEFAKGRISERPAWPKSVRALAALPLTGVGKVYKPALRADAAKRALERVLLPVAGDHLDEITAAEGGSRGMRVAVRLKQPTEQVKAAVSAVLGSFIVDVQLLDGVE